MKYKLFIISLFFLGIFTLTFVSSYQGNNYYFTDNSIVTNDLINFHNLSYNYTIITKGASGEWDGTGIREIGNILNIAGQYILTYTGHNGTYSQTNSYCGWANSSNGFTWVKQGQLVNARQCEDPYLLYNGTTYLLYAENKNETTFANISLHTSTNLTSWNFVGNVLSPPTGTTGWDLQDVSSPTLLYEDGTYYMFYEGRNSTNDGQIGLATSTDGLTFTKSPSNPFITFDYGMNRIEEGLVPDSIQKSNGIYYLTAHTGSGTVTGYFRSSSINTKSSWVSYIANPFRTISDIMISVFNSNYFGYSANSSTILGGSLSNGSAKLLPILNRNDNFSISNNQEVFTYTPYSDSSLALNSASSQYAFSYDDPTLDFGSSINYTVSIWVKRTGNPSASQFIVAKDGGGGSTQWDIFSNTNGGISVRNGVGTSLDVNNRLINDSLWHHVAMTHERNTTNGVKVYIDGTLLGMTNLSASGQILNNTANLYFGVRVFSGNLTGFYNGSLDEARIYNTALTSSQVLEINNSRRLTNSSLLLNLRNNLVLYQSFDGQFNNFLTDATTSFNNVFLSNLNSLNQTGSLTNVVNPFNMTILERTNYLAFFINNSFISQSSSTSNFTVLLSRNDTFYVLDNFNLTEGITRQFSPLSISGSSTSKTITSSLTQSITATVVVNVAQCSFSAEYESNGVEEISCSDNVATFNLEDIPTGVSELTLSYLDINCSTNTGASIIIILVFSALSIVALTFIIVVKFREGEFDVKLLIIVFIAIIVGLVLFTQVAQLTGSVCS